MTITDDSRDVVIHTRYLTAVITAPEGMTPEQVAYVTGGIRSMDEFHATIGRALAANDRDHTDLGGGFMVPSLTPFPMSDHEVARWLVDLGIDMGKCPCCNRTFCVNPSRTGW